MSLSASPYLSTSPVENAMDNRYGRHGPHAWRRWHERRYDRCSSYFDNSAYTVIVHVQLPPVKTERIILIIMSDNIDLYQNDGESTSSLSFADSRSISSPQHERTEMYAMLKSYAEYEAEVQFHKDSQSVHERGAEWPEDKTLIRAALIKADVSIREYIRPDLDREEIRDFFVKNYMHRYGEQYEEVTGESVLNNEELTQLKRTAKASAIKDKEDDIRLDEIELNYQAVIHIQHFLGGATRASSGYLERIIGYLPHYKHAYREEIDRTQRSSPFPGSWQSGRAAQL